MSSISQIQVKIDKALSKETAGAQGQEFGGAKQSFRDLLFDGVNAVNEAQSSADKMSTDLATGKSENIHEVMLAVSNAELTFNLMVQLRNKALEAYQEVMRMPV